MESCKFNKEQMKEAKLNVICFSMKKLINKFLELLENININKLN